ncbi:MAG: threonine synthase [Clostridia bacterium]|nr:threonine synthase [Clostridia bacterium]
MRYLSTRGGDAVSAAQAIVMGISPSGGLFVPESFPKLNPASLSGNYRDDAFKVMSLYLTETEPEKLKDIINRAYDRFDTKDVAPVVGLTETESVLELWHGPTMAFKDVALQILPYLMKESLVQTGEDHTVYILVATSGDTGKAALEGFRDVEGTRVLVFYPYGGVSRMQRLQMVTQEGANMDVCAVRGNFDDAQTGVKQIFGSEEMKRELGNAGYRLSSANSINFGRLLPQIVYYFTSYRALVDSGRISMGDSVNFCVPTGNFGDILAGYYAVRMGLPVHKLICASNRNNVLTDFFRNGLYNANRPFYKSMSCSIDILVSSNLERLLFEITDRNTETVTEWMRSLKSEGTYSIPEGQRKALSELFEADWCSEEDTLQTIRRVFGSRGYLMDPHTAVAQTVYERYTERTGDSTQTILLSTANPYKFASDVLSIFETPCADDFENAERLRQITGKGIPANLRELRKKPELHTDVCNLNEMPERVRFGVSK